MDSLTSISTISGNDGVAIGRCIHSTAILPTVRTPISSHRSNHILGGGFLHGLIMLNPASIANCISLRAILISLGQLSCIG